MILLDAGASERGWSWRSNLLRCPHKAALIMAGFRGSDRDALVRGSIFHVGLAHHYGREMYGQNDEDASELYAPLEAMRAYVRKTGEGEEFLPLLTDTYEAYEAEHAVELLKIVAVEELIRFKVPGPATGELYTHTMRVDMIVQDASGRFWIWDHKTTGYVDNKKKPGFELSGQVLGGTWWGRREYGSEWGGFVIKMVPHHRRVHRAASRDAAEALRRRSRAVAAGAPRARSLHGPLRRVRVPDVVPVRIPTFGERGRR